MASAIIHICVANEINKKIKKDKNKLLIGSIAPDISKQVNETKKHSHFLTDNNDIPNLSLFMERYKNKLDDDFVLGYYIHLYTDYLWYKYYMPEIFSKNVIKKLDGEEVECKGRMASMYIYSDYTTLNRELIDNYELDLSIFYREIPKLENIIKEIPMDKINIIVEKMGLLIANVKENKHYVMDLEGVSQFIKISTELILSHLNEISI